jgi:hypothetical protein
MTAQTRFVRLKDADPRVNPGWMTQEEWNKEVAKNPKDLSRRVRITITEGA